MGDGLADATHHLRNEYDAIDCQSTEFAVVHAKHFEQTGYDGRITDIRLMAIRRIDYHIIVDVTRCIVIIMRRRLGPVIELL